MDIDEIEHQTRERDPQPASPSAPPAPKPAPKPTAKKVRLVIRVVTGLMEPIEVIKISMREFGKANSPIPLSPSADGAFVGDVTTNQSTLSVLVQTRPDEPIPRLYNLLVRPDGSVNGNKDVLVQVNNITSGGQHMASVRLIFPRVTDVTDSLVLSGPFAGLVNNWILPEKSIPIVNMADFFASRELQMKFTASSKVSADIVIFNVEGLQVKRPVAVAIPKGLKEFNNVVMFYHHNIRQNAVEFEKKGGQFPFGMAHLLFGFFHYLGGKRGMAYQLAASRRKAIFVLPMPGLDGVGEFDSDSDTIKGVLREIIAHFNRTRKADFTPAQLGRLAVGSYSSGVEHLQNLFQSGGSILKQVNEVYDFDGAHANNGKHLNGQSFAGKGRLVRRYGQHLVNLPAGRAFERLNPSLFSLPWFRWLEEESFPFKGKTVGEVNQLIRKSRGLEKTLAGYVHGVMPAYMLFHALSISEFPKM